MTCLREGGGTWGDMGWGGWGGVEEDDKSAGCWSVLGESGGVGWTGVYKFAS